MVMQARSITRLRLSWSNRLSIKINIHVEKRVEMGLVYGVCVASRTHSLGRLRQMIIVWCLHERCGSWGGNCWCRSGQVDFDILLIDIRVLAFVLLNSLLVRFGNLQEDKGQH